MALDSKQGSALHEINMIPLVDVMLVLLIIFMVTAPLLQQGVDVSLPAVNAPELPLQEDQFVVTITKERKVYLNRAPLTLSQLGAKLQALYQDRSRKEVFLRSDKDVPYGFVVEVMGLIRKSGIGRVGMVTEATTVTEP